MENQKVSLNVDSTLWIVEDNESFRHDMVNLISHTEGLQCEGSFSSCEAAIDELDRSAAPDILLMDIGLPGINGIEGTKRVKAIAPSIQVMMLTAFDENEKIFQALCAGASGYLLKSDTPEKIVDSLREIAIGGAPINAQIAKKVLDMFMKIAAPMADYGLTTREKDVLRLLVDGLLKKQIAAQLSISYHTVDTHIRNIYEKLHVQSRSGAIAKALRERIL